MAQTYTPWDLSNDLTGTFNTNYNQNLLDVEADIETEETARISADTTLQNNINAEATIRATNDTQLQTNIDTVNTRLDTLITDPAPTEQEIILARRGFATLQASIERAGINYAIIDPTVNDIGYSFWVNTTTEQAFILIDDTAGGAVWEVIDSGVITSTSAPTPLDDDYKIGQIWIKTDTSDVYMIIDNTVNTAVWFRYIDFLDVGDVSTLNTTAQTIVSSINELDVEIGDLSTLNTTDKTSLVNAVNEVNSKEIPQPNDYGRGIEISYGFADSTVVDGSVNDNKDLVMGNTVTRSNDVNTNSSSSAYGVRYSPDENHTGLTIFKSELTINASKAILLDASKTLISEVDLIDGEAKFSQSFIGGTNYYVALHNQGSSWTFGQDNAAVFPYSNGGANITGGLLGAPIIGGGGTDSADTAPAIISIRIPTTQSTATQTHDGANLDAYDNLSINIDGLDGANNSVVVDVLGKDETVSRSADNTSDTASSPSGLRITTSATLSGISGTISANTSGITKAYLYQGITKLVESDIVSGEFYLPYNILASTSYDILVDSEGSNYTRGFNNSQSYPVNGTDFNISSGLLAINTTSGSSAFSIISLTSLESLKSQTFNQTTDNKRHFIDLTQADDLSPITPTLYPTLQSVITENRTLTTDPSPSVNQFSVNGRGEQTRAGDQVVLDQVTTTTNLSQYVLSLDKTKYKKAILELTNLRSNAGVAIDELDINFNSDATSGHYSYTYTQSDSPSILSSNAFTSIRAGACVGGSSASYFGNLIIEIDLDTNSAKFHGGATLNNSQGRSVIGSGNFNVDTDIASLELSISGTTIRTDTNILVIGVTR